MMQPLQKVADVRAILFNHRLNKYSVLCPKVSDNSLQKQLSKCRKRNRNTEIAAIMSCFLSDFEYFGKTESPVS